MLKLTKKADYVLMAMKHLAEHADQGSCSAKDVADGLEQWVTERACDGFVVAASHVPGAYEDFVRLVVPELQRRGVYHKDYEGPTLRETLGLPRPAVGAWRSVAAE